MYRDTVECPYCYHDNNTSDALADLDDNHIFDIECEECEEEFEVEVEFDPSYYPKKIEYNICENCGDETRNAFKKGKVFPWLKQSDKNVLCYNCFWKADMKERNV